VLMGRVLYTAGAALQAAHDGQLQHPVITPAVLARSVLGHCP
jgi:hypothetical protein